MQIAIVKETAPGERRVALVPESAKKLIQAGYSISMESGAGVDAGFPDPVYREVNVSLLRPRRDHFCRRSSAES
jgi:NAD(P) transhydrogenase subunit alpha